MIDTIAAVVMTANGDAAGVSMHAGPTSGMLRRDALRIQNVSYKVTRTI